VRKTDILDVVSRKLAPFVMLFGFYLVANGHLSPGGGFQGGVVIASAVILLLLAQEAGSVTPSFPLTALSVAESAALFVFISVGIVGLLAAGAFLSVFLPLGSGTTVFDSGFIFVLNLVIGVKVGAGITLICFHILEAH